MKRPSRLTLISLAILALPLAAGLIATAGLQRPLPTFHDGDESIYHYPSIQKFATTLPNVNVLDYNSATTPLFHLVLASAARGLDLDLIGLRWVNLLISYAALIVLYLFLARRFLRNRDALLLALVFSLTPYFFGRAFRLFTENMAFGFCVLGLYLAMRARDNLSDVRWLGAAASFVGAVLTRQSTAWLPTAVGAGQLAKGRESYRLLRAMVLAGGPVLALIPFVYFWGGLVPPASQELNVSQTVNAKAVVFAFAVLGFYSMLLVPKTVFECVRHPGRIGLLTAVCGLAIVAVAQLSPRFGNDGFLWRIAGRFPDVSGGNLLFYLLVPVGLMISVGVRKPGALPSLYFPLFALSFVVSGKSFQNYYDSYVLLFLFDRVAADGGELGASNTLGLLALAGLSIGYLTVQMR